MIELKAEEVQAMKAQPNEVCPECGRKVRKNFCRDCHQYFWHGHLNDCPRMRWRDGQDTDDHRGHRTY